MLNLLKQPQKKSYDPFGHYAAGGPVHEFGDLEETPPHIENIGWSLGNYCPYGCKHCYSTSARLAGADLTKAMVDRIVEQLSINGIKTVNIGGNEPIFTCGSDVQNSLLPYIITSLKKRGIEVGITTSGITLIHLYNKFRHAFELLNDIDISLDSPFQQEHDGNRGVGVYKLAVKALGICKVKKIPFTIVMAAMRWNFSPEHIAGLIDIANDYGSNVRINVLKPTEKRHYDLTITPEQYYAGFKQLMTHCESVEVGDPVLAALFDKKVAKGCPCGRTSFRIHSITPDGRIFVSPCVYLHDYKSRLNLLEHDLKEIIHSPEFRLFRQRNKNTQEIEGCNGCSLIEKCKGGCAAHSYLHHAVQTGEKSFKKKDPYCPIDYWKEHGHSFPKDDGKQREQILVHMDYLCTWIGKPKER